MKINLIIAFVAVVILNTSCSDSSINLVENGVSDYEIVFKGDATKEVYKSAEVLQAYLEKISGARLDIVDESSQTVKNKIYIGNINDEELGVHQLKITTSDENLIISGGSDKAINNAVYVFLENYLGCKWYSPTVEKIPESNSVSIPLTINYSFTPEITTRTVHSRLFYENHDYADKQKVTYEAFPKYVPKARVHTFHRFVPEEKFYKSNPEFYAWRGEKRLPTQLCLTNETVLSIVKDSVKAMFERNPEASVISVSQDDNQQYCLCDSCSAIDKAEGSPAGTMIHFVNKVAEAFPDKIISTLAYQHTRKPCKTQPAENVLITLCSIECDRSGPIEDKCADFSEDLKGWGKLTDNIRIWDYTTQFTNFLAPFPNIHTLKPNIELFKNNGAQWIFEQHSNNPSELFELRSYITAKLLWDPTLELNGLVTEFTNGYYEEAGDFIKQYVDLVHTKIKADPEFFLFLYGDPSQAFDSFLSAELLSEYSILFDKAEKAINDSPEVLKRVKRARLGIDYAVLEASRKGISEQFKLIVNEGGNMKINPLVEKLLNDFKKTTDEGEILLMNEMGFTVAEYLSSYQKALDVAIQPNIALGKKVQLLTTPKKYADEDPQVLTDGALGGNGFYANWLGFEGNDLEAVVDLGTSQEIAYISVAFLQVTNHVVFYPTKVTYYGSADNKNFEVLGTLENKNPLSKKSKVNDIQYFDLKEINKNIRYLKIRANNMGQPPYWHHAAGTPAWIFADEILVN
ncbi:DUF4838 domain-containing protein [Maribacter sp. HTCC2170]|uniref:DUF4838 domain-containing protein n=1 Tax=Maribacter sp. (strain HTCC2170 / KCCM 42371) TaxID=313603 RepID=UPI00006BE0D9|nr:DUF4838 domain-containing protein [Maribacter sp. HTCC2170]EAQ99985.1 hypothetical protein FB2170_01387 [Maribacter sp. HTCC2170]